MDPGTGAPLQERSGARLQAALRRGAAALARTPGWAVGTLCLLMGVGVGLLAANQVLNMPVARQGAAVPAVQRPATPVAERASVAGPHVGGVPVPGETVTLTWRVTNSGEREWDVTVYRFVPASLDLPVVPLPRPVAGKETVTVRISLTVPEQMPVWTPLWHLNGPRGPIRGGELGARIELAGM